MDLCSHCSYTWACRIIFHLSFFTTCIAQETGQNVRRHRHHFTTILHDATEFCVVYFIFFHKKNSICFLNKKTKNRIQHLKETMTFFHNLFVLERTSTRLWTAVAGTVIYNTITPVVGYKAFDEDFKCRDFQYEVGRTYKLGVQPHVCKMGYHFCFEPHECDNHYDPMVLPAPRHALVRAKNLDIYPNWTEAASGELTVVRELDNDEWKRYCANPWLGQFSTFKGLYHEWLTHWANYFCEALLVCRRTKLQVKRRTE